MTTRPQCAKENQRGEGDEPKPSTSSSEGHECDDESESEQMLSQGPAANPQIPDADNEPYVTRSGRVVKPRVTLDLWTNCENHTWEQLIVLTVHFVHFVRREM